jgi:5-methylcytosine-specific restriction endonuclease McrA
VFDVQVYNPRLNGCGYKREPAARCYRCPKLLNFDTITVDRIIPGCKGGTYRRNNIRPACGPCNSSTGAKLGHERRAAA